MIFYFSGTGNSRFAAMKLAHMTNDKAINIADIFKGVQIRKEGNQDVTGFVFPVYYWGLPEMVERFISLPGVKNLIGSYVYCVITCGGDPAGADKKLEKALNRQIDFSASVVMPDNYVMAYDPCTNDKAKTKLAEADKKLEELSKLILLHKTKSDNSPLKNIISTILPPFYNLFRTTRFFNADESCTGCERCVSLCPDQAIEIQDGKPVWIKDKCQHCTACINACPSKAIQFTGLTKKRGRYYILNIK